MSTAIENERNELKPCPFCGADAILLENSNGPCNPSEFVVDCTRYCIEKKNSPQEAIVAWNRRQP